MRWFNARRTAGSATDPRSAWQRLTRPHCVLLLLAAVVVVLSVFGLPPRPQPVSAQSAVRLRDTYSSPIVVTQDDRTVWCVNPDNNSVSVFLVAGDANRKIAEIPVGVEPQSVAILPDISKAYVTNQASGNVAVIDVRSFSVLKYVRVGTEPHGCTLTPDGSKLYVANMNSNSVSVISTLTDSVIETITGLDPKPYALTVTNTGFAEEVFVTHFLALTRDDSRTLAEKEGRDDGKVGRVTVISAQTDEVIGFVNLDGLTDTGFNADGNTLDKKPLTQGNNPVAGNANTLPTGAFPNLLEGIAIKGNRAYIPSTASSPNGPVRFNVNVQGFLTVFDTEALKDSGQTLNMNRGVQFEPVGTRLFNTNPFAIAFKHNANEGFCVLGATNRVVRVLLSADGTPTIGAPLNTLDRGSIIRIEVGENPRGIWINGTDTRAYVFNYISRDISVLNIQAGNANVNTQIARIASTALPTAGTLAAIVHDGKRLFDTSIGPEGTQENSRRPAGRMSDFGWGSCYSCHPNGLTDGVTWMFTDGPRQTISMESTFAHPQPGNLVLNGNGSPVAPSSDQRVLNWSAVRDENADFELNIRNVSGGEGLITDGQAVVNLTPTATTGRSTSLDAITAYLAFGIRAPIAPRPSSREGFAEAREGRQLFDLANCQLCHGGPKWTRSRVNFAPPPNAAAITDGQLVAFLRKVGSFDPTGPNELKANQTANVTANGALGFNVPSLLSVFAGEPYLYSGLAPTLEDVLENVVHRSAGTSGVDRLRDPDDRRKVAAFLKTIDANTPIFP